MSAEESAQIKKIRKKLKKHFLEINQRITPQSLKKTSLEIYHWIACHNDRVVLRSKSMALFDENRNSTKPSSKVAHVIAKLKKC